MTRKAWVSILLVVCTLSLLLTSCGDELSIGVDDNVYIGMSQEELIDALGEPSATYEEEEGVHLVGYDQRTLYDIVFRVDYYFDDTGLFKANYSSYVEQAQAQEVFNAAYADVAAAFGSLEGFVDMGVQGVFGQDERVYVYMEVPMSALTDAQTDAETYTAYVAYEYGEMIILCMPQNVPVQ